MDCMTTKEASAKWGYSEAAIRKWYREEKRFVVCKAVKKSGRWQIPADAQCPAPVKDGK